VKHDDPLERLAAEEDWSRRAKAIEAEVARERRKARISSSFRPRRARRVRRLGPPRGISPVFVGLVAVTVAAGALLWTETGPQQAWLVFFVLGSWLITLSLHEFAHALTAHRGGDDTVADKGYLTLNPLKYGHPVLTVLLPMLFLMTGGLPLPGGAVQIETHRLRNRLRDSLVSLAGPSVNILAAAVLLAYAGSAGPDFIGYLTQPRAYYWAAITVTAYLQVATAILNLLPIPGLDGYGVIEPFLSSSLRYTGRRIAPFGFLIVMLLLLLPPLRDAFGTATMWFVDTSGAPINGVAYGFDLFVFWRSL
jgi:Zn-dependent protease